MKEEKRNWVFTAVNQVIDNVAILQGQINGIDLLVYFMPRSKLENVSNN